MGLPKLYSKKMTKMVKRSKVKMKEKDLHPCQKLKRAAKFHLMPYKVDVLFYNRRRAQDDAYFINLLFLKGGATEEREDGEGGATEEREDGDSEDLDLT
ncbi:uncharacterized protein LOC107797972 isoform X1 [Nicotiana tabacum]|uniref:Uncharacterized protein LOC107797972 isoform X1 n=2 Tax=Nicotiana tabacum TaxID=4097 RepID=A0AC58SWD5_TOBAC